MKIYLIWLIGVIAWNYNVPEATLMEDIIFTMVLTFLSIGLKKIIK